MTAGRRLSASRGLPFTPTFSTTSRGAVGGHRHPRRVDQLAPSGDEGLDPGGRIDPDHPAVGDGRRAGRELAHVGHVEAAAARRDRDIVGMSKEVALRAVSRHLDQATGGGSALRITAAGRPSRLTAELAT